MSKKISICLYYLVSIMLLIMSFIDLPKVIVDVYDMTIYKLSSILLSFGLLYAMLFRKKFKLGFKFTDSNKLTKKVKIINYFSILFVFLTLSIFTQCLHSKNYNNELNKNIVINNSNLNNGIKSEISGDKIKIHYIDVGQGDSIFIEYPDGETMLIDAGESSFSKTVYDYICNLNYSKIDYLIGTHPHSDHIGGLEYIVRNFDIGNIYMPKVSSNSKTFESLLNSIKEKGLKINNARAGVSIIDRQNLKVEVIAPNSDSYTSINNYSIVLKVTYYDKKFLFMGDAEVKSENEIKTDVSADVIKIGHHGSDTSSDLNFVNRVNAKYVIVMVGKNNTYRHPNSEILDRWSNTGAKIYRTDLNGDIILTSDGSNVSIDVTKE